MKNLLFNMKSVITGSYKAIVGAETFWKSEQEREPKQIVSAPQHYFWRPKKAVITRSLYHYRYLSPVVFVNRNTRQAWLEISTGRLHTGTGLPVHIRHQYIKLKLIKGIIPIRMSKRFGTDYFRKCIFYEPLF